VQVRRPHDRRVVHPCSEVGRSARLLGRVLENRSICDIAVHDGSPSAECAAGVCCERLGLLDPDDEVVVVAQALENRPAYALAAPRDDDAPDHAFTSR
jgi:hypothetical protein